MIAFEEAFRIVMESVFETETETISFTSSAGRILAEEISSDIDMPPFNRSAVDGYACHKTDLKNELEVLEVVAAGQIPAKIVGENQCSKIMTGAMVPDGCDIVIMVEDSIELGSEKIRFNGNDPKINISFRGEDVRIGDTVLKSGKFIKPQDIAVMASVGRTGILVRKMPGVGIISTGDELVEPSELPGISQIRNSNAYQLLTQVSRAGGEGHYYGIPPDNENRTFEVIQNALKESDIVILSGGVSMGDFDFVPSVLKRAGVKILFDRINVQPGKPTVFGIHSKALVFGLPGNPVSSFIQFETLVRPLISLMMGYEWKAPGQKLPMSARYERRSHLRMGWVPVRITENREIGRAHV
jgi:molybdopterin molybdotransferase